MLQSVKLQQVKRVTRCPKELRRDREINANSMSLNCFKVAQFGNAVTVIRIIECDNNEMDDVAIHQVINFPYGPSN
jgi:hypothetical protein